MNIDRFKMLSTLLFQLLSLLRQVVLAVPVVVEAELELELKAAVVVERLEDSELVAAVQSEFVALPEVVVAAAAAAVVDVVDLPYAEEFDLEVVDSSFDDVESCLAGDVVEAFQDDSASCPSADASGERHCDRDFEDVVVHLK